MKKRTLEILLQHIPPPTKPIPNLEQYLTPANIASDIIFTAHQWGDIDNKKVIDLGCGTGIFAIGAALTGAKKVIGYDIDKNVITTAKEYAKKNNLTIQFVTKDIAKVTTKADTVVMNPPFGAQKSNLKADQRFLKKGFEIASVMYSLHLKKTLPYLERMILSLGGEITYEKDYVFPIKWTFDFHDKEIVPYDVTLLRVVTHR